MKKLSFLLLAMAATFALQAQWVDDPATNTFIANCGNDDGEIYLSTCTGTGDTYVQWEGSSSNGWSPTLQRLNFEGIPQWGTDGIHIGGHQFSSMSEGVAMASTADGGVVSCFAVYDGFTYAVKINADGTFAWGEQGIQLFDGQGFSRTELTAGTDGGMWALGFDYNNLFLQYIEANGTLNPTITVSATGGYSAMYGQLTLGKDNDVFLTYEKAGSGFYTDKEIFVVGFKKDGTQLAPEMRLMASQTFQVTYNHRVVSDGNDGGYAYLWHPGIGGAFNTYVFHFDQNGFSTISDIDGVTVHSADPSYFYRDANATVDPISHDLIIAYLKVDASTQSENSLYMNRISATGERQWGDGILVADNTGLPYSDIRIDAFEDGSGFSIVYNKGTDNTGYRTTVEAIGLDMEGNTLWTKQLNSINDSKRFCDNSTGFHLGQNIVAWVNSSNGGLYGQNLGTDGSMGPIETPEPCFAPTNFDGSYVYNTEDQTFGALLTWDAPETQPLHYNLYVHTPDGCVSTIEIEPTEPSYYDQMTIIGEVIYRLTAVYEDCESDYALTTDGENYVSINVTGIEENMDSEIVSVTKVYTLNGQLLNHAETETLGNGVYIIQGLTRSGNLVTKKMAINH